MAKNVSESNKYPSRYSPGGWVRPDQYIAELMCERRARHLDKDLPVKFWNLQEWKGYFMYQLKLAQGLMKQYPAKAIVMALRDKKTYNLYSLKVKWFKPIVEHYNKTCKSPDITQEDAPKQTGTSFKRKEFNQKKNIVNRLEEIDDN